MNKKKSKSKKDNSINNETAALPFPIVGIGASAGGLAAFEAFFSGMPKETETGMAFILVQHLSPEHKSLLTELVGRYTSMPVIEVSDGMTVEPDRVYVIPPGHNMAFLNGSLQLLEISAQRGQRLPIDFFFHSLAQDQGERVIGVVLSGTGSDGTIGVRAIKGEGGMIIAQTPESTEYDSMPRSVIATGLADYELPPAEMAAAIINYVDHAFNKQKPADIEGESPLENILKKIFILVRARTGHDFSSYKPSTLRRRIERRMAVHQIDSIEGYLRYLQQSDDEIDSLFKNLLIGVTNFFRDIEVFKELEKTVIPKLFVNKKEGSLLRIWSAGCSTGEEAFSIAILMQEYMESIKHSFTVQIFATDIDPLAIATARQGIYPASITADITPERLAHFFTADPEDQDGISHSYRINKNIRDMLIFSEQNVVKDPPFSKLDLICCRNLMIYLNNDLQKKLIYLFHYALNPNCFLFLGTSETIGELSNLFQPLDRKSKLYMRKESMLSAQGSRVGGLFPLMPHSNLAEPVPIVKNSPQKNTSLRNLAEQTLLKQLAPAGALINSSGDIFYLHGRTGMYLEPVEGEVRGYNILKMAREGLGRAITKALRKAVQGKEVVRCADIRVKNNESFITVNITICPANQDSTVPLSNQMYLVSIETAKSTEPVQEQLPSQLSGNTAEVNEESDEYKKTITALREDLRTREEELNTTSEELETMNEELKSSNEEMQSVNEELQSSNEELETSKEELQSVNEELSTVNSELSIKVDDLSHLNNDMNNLLAGTGVATIFVDYKLRIMRFTPTASELINLIPTDVGRPVNHILTNLTDYKTLSEDLQEVLNSLIPKSIEVKTEKGRWFMMNIQPYRTLDNVIEGAVISFSDITELRHYQDELKKQLSEKEILLLDVHHRVKNNILSIENMLKLQASSADNDDVRTALQDTISRIQSMRVLYDKLLMGNEYNVISIKRYIEGLIDSIVAVFSESNKVIIDRQIEDFNLESKTAITLGIIINEVLTNIFKYAFKNIKNCTLFISIKKTENSIALIIHDNGIGIDEKMVSDNSTGFGLTIVKMLVEQLRGTYNFTNDNGTKFDMQTEV